MAALATVDEFKARVQEIQTRPGFKNPAAYAVGIASYGASGAVLDTYYPHVNLDDNPGSASSMADAVGYMSGGGTTFLTEAQITHALDILAPLLVTGNHPNARAFEAGLTLLRSGSKGLIKRAPVVTFIDDLQSPPLDIHDVYLRLHLLSYRRKLPNSINLEGIFGFLPNVVWTNLGPFEAADFERRRLELKLEGHEVQVNGVDKFPRLTDYVVPSGVRIADANRVRLGAHLAEGTTVMHEGFANFNAGTLGASMVEGRISQGVIVGNGSDVGGGASIMGTLSGGGKEVIRVGEGSLIGANAGIGISIGNGCTVEAGLYVTAGSRVTLPDGRIVKAAELSGQDDLLFRRNSQNGAIEVVAKKNQVVLNAALHAN